MIVWTIVELSFSTLRRTKDMFIMHPQHMCALIYQYIRPSQKDNKLVCNLLTKYFIIAMNNHFSNLDIDTIDHGKIIDYTTHHVCQEITAGMMRRCCRWWWRCTSPRGRGSGLAEGGAGGGSVARRRRQRRAPRQQALWEHRPLVLLLP
jgi:hypothetical protein